MSTSRSLRSRGTLAVLALLLASAQNYQIAAQDILRQRAASQPAPTPTSSNDPLANLQLPPQLASLSPQQLHQLARLRELQLQHQAAQQQQQPQPPPQQNQNLNQNSQQAPAPIGFEALQPTATPSSTASNQIPQPNTGSSPATSGQTSNDGGERLDDAVSYTESGTEVEGSQAASGATSGAEAPASSSQAAPSFEVNWNKCPQLEPSESEKNKKTQVITKCLQSAPIPANLTRENVENHREQIATCALRVEGWFDDQGNYKYDKAEAEIRGKKLESAIELQVLKFHVACKDEASKKFPRDQNKLIDQVQFYQACMDYYISIVCEIEVSVDQ